MVWTPYDDEKTLTDLCKVPQLTVAEYPIEDDFDMDSDEWERYINDDEDQMEDSQDEEIGEMASVKIIGIDDDNFYILIMRQ